MPAPKSLSSFPAVFSMILEHFRQPGAEAKRVPFPSVTEAAKTRFRFYDFKKLINRSGDEDKIRVIGGIMIRLTELPNGKAELEFLSRDDQDWAKALEEAFFGSSVPLNSRSAGGEPPHSPSSVTEQRKSAHDAAIEDYLRAPSPAVRKEN